VISYRQLWLQRRRHQTLIPDVSRAHGDSVTFSAAESGRAFTDRRPAKAVRVSIAGLPGNPEFGLAAQAAENTRYATMPLAMK
jgi:hypothetical protein